MNYKTTTKNRPRTVVAVNYDVHHKVMEYAKAKGMKLNKVVEFAILDYLTKAQK